MTTTLLKTLVEEVTSIRVAPRNTVTCSWLLALMLHRKHKTVVTFRIVLEIILMLL
jgi:hypothetical protein